MATTRRTSIALLILTLGLLLNSCKAGNILNSGQSLTTGNSLSYAQYQFVMQADCNLVLYDNGNAVWASNTNGRGSGCQCRMQSDGNLVVYTNSNRAVWASNTNRGTGSYQCILQRDRNVVVYDPQGRPIWATRTNVLASTDVTLYVAKPTNATASTPADQLNNVTVSTPAEKTTVTGTAGKKIDSAVNPTLT